MTMWTGKASQHVAYWSTGFRKPQAAYLTLPARLLMETRLICMGTSVAASVCSTSSGAVRLVRSSRCTISAARHTSVSLSEICKSRTRQLPVHCKTADWSTTKMLMCGKVHIKSASTDACQAYFELLPLSQCLLLRARCTCCVHLMCKQQLCSADATAHKPAGFWRSGRR